MRFKIRKIYAAAAAVNAAALIGAGVLTLTGSSLARSQQYNYAGKRWSDGEDSHVQVSSFFSDDANVTLRELSSIRGQLYERLLRVSESSENGKKLIPDAYSTPVGSSFVTCDIKGCSEAEITAVGGDFFLFRDFRLLDGSFFDKDDLMQDGAVIDRDLAWRLYGSDMISGKNIYINGVRFYIAGVVDTPSTKPEKDTVGSTPRAYISYEYAEKIGSSSDEGAPPEAAGGSGMKITCYECIMPDPVEDFGYTAVKETLSETYRGKVDIVNNNERFEPKKRAKAYKKRTNYAVHGNGIIYPYWENASRIVEFRLSELYHARKCLMMIPFMTILLVMLKLIRAFYRVKPKLKRQLSDRIGRLWEKFRIRN